MFERFLTGGTLRVLQLRLEERRLFRCIDREGPEHPMCKAQEEQWRLAEFCHRFGPVPHEKDFREQVITVIESLQDLDVPERECRLLVTDRIIERAVRQKLNPKFESAAAMLGWLFIGACGLGGIGMLGLVWFGDVTALLKITSSTIIVTVFGLGMYAMALYTIIPSGLFRRYMPCLNSLAQIINSRGTVIPFCRKK